MSDGVNSANDLNDSFLKRGPATGITNTAADTLNGRFPQSCSLIPNGAKANDSMEDGDTHEIHPSAVHPRVYDDRIGIGFAGHARNYRPEINRVERG
jgi:hypothetical protein